MTDRRRNRARRPSGATASRPSSVERRQPAPGTRRRLLVVGPGLIIALLASGVLVWGGSTKWGARERSPVTPSSPRPLTLAVAPAPDPAFVLRRRADLHLTERQTQQVNRLADRFDRETAGDRAALQQATDDFARHMEGRAGKRVLLPDVQEQTASVSQLSRQLAAARRAVWARLSPVLTSEQRAHAEALWARQWTPGSVPASAAPARAGGER